MSVCVYVYVCVHECLYVCVYECMCLYVYVVEVRREGCSYREVCGVFLFFFWLVASSSLYWYSYRHCSVLFQSLQEPVPKIPIEEKKREMKLYLINTVKL